MPGNNNSMCIALLLFRDRKGGRSGTYEHRITKKRSWGQSRDVNLNFHIVSTVENKENIETGC